MKLPAGARLAEPSNVHGRALSWPSTCMAARLVLLLSSLSLIDAKALKGHGPASSSVAKLSSDERIHAASPLPGKGGDVSRTKRITALVNVSAGRTNTAPAQGLTMLPAAQPWKLRLCNAYAYEGWVHVFHSFGRRGGMDYTADSDGESRLTDSSGPLPFKRCADVSGVKLAPGSLLKFRIGGSMDIGTFFVEELPPQGSMLQLAIKRKDTWSTAADFSSHVFADIPEPQIALVNAYLGRAKSVLEVRDVLTGLENLQQNAPIREENLNFGTVVEISPGSYEWRLVDLKLPKSHAEKASVEFKATENTQYTVLRVGAEAVGGQSFPEELVVWPADGVEINRGSGGSGGNNKGLFGIPKDLSMSKRSRRSGAALQTMSSVTIVILALLFQIALA